MSDDQFSGENRRKRFQWSNVQFTGKDMIQLGVFLGSIFTMWYGLSGKVDILSTSFVDFKEKATDWEQKQSKRIEKIEDKVDILNDKIIDDHSPHLHNDENSRDWRGRR